MELETLLAIVSLFLLEKDPYYTYLRSALPKCITILLLIGRVRIVSLVTCPNRS